jgi:uroporphyrinogen decarboxylase
MTNAESIKEKAMLCAIAGQKSDRLPIWFLRQAGRYLPEYQKLRQQIDFVDLCKNPKKAAEVTLMPLQRFDLDAAIIFSDILILPEALGQHLSFGKGHGPCLSPTVSLASDLLKMEKVSVTQKLDYLAQALVQTKLKLPKHVTLIGFAGAPFTLASYMIEGGSSKNFLTTKKFAFNNKDFFKKLLDILSEKIADLLYLQAQAGAEVLMLFDSWAGCLHPSDYQEYVLPAVKNLLTKFKEKSKKPVIYYPGSNPYTLSKCTDLGVNVVAVDWRFDLEHSWSLFDKGQCVQGNLDPQSLFAPKDNLQDKIHNILNIAKNKKFIFNVGHGLLPQTPIESLQHTIKVIRSFKG